MSELLSDRHRLKKQGKDQRKVNHTRNRLIQGIC